MKRTLEQERAKDALDKVREVEKRADAEVRDKFASYVSGLAPSIINNGLGQSCAGLLARAKGDPTDPHYELYRYLENWLCRDEPEAPYRGAKDLMDALTKGDRFHYLRAQAEALSWLEWLKRFSAAYLKSQDTQKASTESGGEG